MSRDQRPGREVMVDSPLDAPAPSAAASTTVDAAPPAPKSRVMLGSILFLLACAGAAVGTTLMPFGGG